MQPWFLKRNVCCISTVKPLPIKWVKYPWNILIHIVKLYSQQNCEGKYFPHFKSSFHFLSKEVLPTTFQIQLLSYLYLFQNLTKLIVGEIRVSLDMNNISIFLKKILFERKRQSMSRGKRQREKGQWGRENQTPHWTGSPRCGSIPEINLRLTYWAIHTPHNISIFQLEVITLLSYCLSSEYNVCSFPLLSGINTPDSKYREFGGWVGFGKKHTHYYFSFIPSFSFTGTVFSLNASVEIYIYIH